jgi:hypothetical protein
MTDAIAYCPYCGSHLEELLEATPEEYAELATKHKPFATGLTVPDLVRSTLV